MHSLIFFLSLIIYLKVKFHALKAKFLEISSALEFFSFYFAERVPGCVNYSRLREKEIKFLRFVLFNVKN